MDDLPEVFGRSSGVTLNKYLGRLSMFWKWLLKREHVEANVWAGLRLPVSDVSSEQQERPFTDDEMRALLSGAAKPALHDVMMIAALSGARLDAVVDLKVGPCREGQFAFKPQKKERGFRMVPIHSALVDLVTRRIEGRANEDDLFPEWPVPKRAGSQRERSFKTSNAFTAYRRAVGVDERVPGKRRGLVNFHSFRRWFITQAERADQPESIIAIVVGHKRKGMTLGRYSAGPLLEQCRRCVEAVALPQVAKP
jgi:integrase